MGEERKNGDGFISKNLAGILKLAWNVPEATFLIWS
jgi:hypothetical protein